MSIRIAIDIRPTQINYSGHGIGNYTENLVQAIHEVDNTNEYFLLYHPSFVDNLPQNLKDNFTLHQLPLSVKKPIKGYSLYFDQVVLPRILRELEIDVYHSTDFNPPFRKPCGVVTTIYDLALLKYPYLTGHSRMDNWIYKWKLFNSKRSEAIITISEYSKNDIIKLLKVNSEKVSVIYQSYNPKHIHGVSLEKDDELHERHDGLGASGPYLLYVGGLNNRMKNLEMLMDAFGSISSKHENMKLVICGKKTGKYFEEMYQKYTKIAKEHGIYDRVIFTGYVTIENLISLYQHATLLVFPSRHEGFGLPIIEAMSWGCPVLAARATAVPEAVGDGGLLFDPDSLDDLVEKIDQIISDPALREELIQKGRQRVKQLSWERAAKQTIELYEKVGGKV